MTNGDTSRANVRAAIKFVAWGVAVTVVLSVLGLFLPDVPVVVLAVAWMATILTLFAVAFARSRRTRR